MDNKSPKKGYAKKDFDKEKMYQKIMPSMVREGEGPPLGNVPSLHNYMEDILLEKLPTTIKLLHSCDCVRCQRDIMALALNQLPPMYVVMAEGENQERKLLAIKSRYDAKATGTLIRAARLVRAQPRHTGA